MAGDPESWLSIETVEKHAPGIIVGALLATGVFFRVIKSGVLVFGDKAKLLVENAELKMERDQLIKDVATLTEKLADRNKRIDQLMGAGG